MANERLTLEIAAKAIGQESIDRLSDSLNRFSAASEGSSNASTRTGNNVRNIGDAFGHSVPQIAAASAAVRAFEGTLSVRAVERFLTDVLKIGPALTKIFPIVGGLAFLDVLYKGGEELYKFYQKWDPVHRAQERSVELAKDLGKEISQLGDQLQKLQFDNLEKAIGKAGSRAIQAQSSAITIQGDRNLIAGFDLDIAQQRNILNAGTATKAIDGSGQRVKNPELMREAEAAAVEIQSLQRERFAAELKLQKDLAEQSKTLMEGIEHQEQITSEAADKAAEEAKKAADKLAEQRKRAQGVVDSEIERSIKDPLAKAFYSTNAKLATFDDPQSRARVAGAGISEIRSVAQDLSRKAVDETQKANEKEIADDQKLFLEVLRERIHTGEEAIAADRKVIELQDALTKQSGLSGARNVSSQGAFADRLTAINPQLSDAQKISALNAQDLATALRKYEIEKETAAGLIDEKSKAEAFHKAELDNEEELQRIKEQNIERIAQLQAQQLQSFKGEIGGAFDALLNHSFGNFLKSQVQGLARTVVENAAALEYKNIAKSIPHAQDPNSTIGKLLAGTPFGADPLKLATDANTAATIANTAALARSVTGGGGGLPSGIGSAAAGVAGSIAGDLGDGLPMASGPWGATGTAGASKGGGFGLNFGTIGKVAAAGGGALAAFSDFRSGGIKNDIAGTGAVLGGAAGIAAMIPGGQAVALGLGIAALATSFVSALFPDPKQVREKGIQKALEQNLYHAPTALNVSQDTSGNYVDFDARGNLRSSNFRAAPQVANPYTWWKGSTPYEVPGGERSPYSQWPGGGAPTAPTTIVVQAFDGPSVHEFVQRNSGAFGNAVATALQNGDGRLHNMIRSVAGN